MSLDQPHGFVKHQTITRDAFLGGRLTLSQPSAGFRAGLDSVLLGAAVGRTRRHVLDLGAGVGTAALVALAHELARSATLVEFNPAMIPLAEANAADNGFAERVTVIAADVTASGALRAAAGLLDNAYDCVIANPPYFAEGQGTLATEAGRAGARHMAPDLLDLWVRAAASAAAAQGEIIFVYPVESLHPLLASFDKRFGAITILPLTPRPEAPAGRVLIRAIKGSRAPVTLLASRALHLPESRDFAPAFDAIFRGAATLDW